MSDRKLAIAFSVTAAYYFGNAYLTHRTVLSRGTLLIGTTGFFEGAFAMMSGLVVYQTVRCYDATPLVQRGSVHL